MSHKREKSTLGRAADGWGLQISRRLRLGKSLNIRFNPGDNERKLEEDVRYSRYVCLQNKRSDNSRNGYYKKRQPAVKAKTGFGMKLWISLEPNIL